MNSSLKDLKATISSLPPGKRAELAEYVLDSLKSDEQEIKAEWLAVAKQRLAEMHSGRVVGIPAEKVLKSLSRTRR
jgi:putative addiction module component (TIGR02574 family)